MKEERVLISHQDSFIFNTNGVFYTRWQVVDFGRRGSRHEVDFLLCIFGPIFRLVFLRP